MIFARLKSGWTAVKFIRVGLGGVILYSSIQNGNIAGMIIGGLFTLLALFTDGVCCAGGSCSIPASANRSSGDHKETVYEELGDKK